MMTPVPSVCRMTARGEPGRAVSWSAGSESHPDGTSMLKGAPVASRAFALLKDLNQALDVMEAADWDAFRWQTTMRGR